MNTVQLVDNCPTVNRWIVAAFVVLFLLMLHGIWYVGIDGGKYRAAAIQTLVEKTEPFAVQCGKTRYDDIIVVSGDENVVHILTKDYAEIEVTGIPCKKVK